MKQTNKQNYTSRGRERVYIMTANQHLRRIIHTQTTLVGFCWCAAHILHRISLEVNFQGRVGAGWGDLLSSITCTCLGPKARLSQQRDPKSAKSITLLKARKFHFQKSAFPKIWFPKREPWIEWVFTYLLYLWNRILTVSENHAKLPFPVNVYEEKV